MGRFMLLQLGTNFLDEPFRICGLGEVVIHLQADRFQSGFKCGIAGQDEGYRARLRSAHCAHYGESVA